MRSLRNICTSILLLFFCFIHKSKAQQCFTVNTVPNYNCVTSVCEITIIVSNSSISPPYTITSSPAGISGIMTTNVFTLTNIPFQSTYNLTVKGSGTCTEYGQVLYNNPTAPLNITVSQTNVACPGGNDGSASAVFGGIAPFTWQWSTGSANPIVSGLSPGVYTVSITDSRTCTATKLFSITEPLAIESAFTKTFVPCFGGTISSAITTTGGNNPFTYTVNGTPVTIAPGNIAANITAGLQTIITKDVRGCLKTNTLIVNQAAQQIISSTIKPPDCPKESSGSILVSVAGPVAGYTYSWSPGNTTSFALNHIPAGNYTLAVLDASSCITTSVITVPPAPAVIPVVTVTKENCSAADGAFTLNVSGGNPPFTYTTLPVNANGTVVTGLSTGNYTSVIIDSHGCIDTTLTYVGNLSTVSLHVLTVTAVQCYNTCNGSVLLNVQNGTSPINYSITGLPVTTNSVLSNLCAGFYVVKATDALGCPAFDTINFPQPAAFSYSASTPPTICIGKKAQLQASASGGTGALSYIWNPSGISGATVNVGPAATTIYSLNVYDSKGCTLPSYTVLVRVNPPISILINTSNAGICPGTTAQITPTVSGGDGNYTYNWLPGESKSASVFVENITVPVYTLTVNDACGSPAGVKEIEIKLHPYIQPLYEQTGSGGCTPYCATFINRTPGSKNAIWNYGDKPFEQAGDTTRYCYEKAGNYNLRLTVTDLNSCKASFTYTGAVNVLLKPDAGFITNPTLITLNEADNVLIKNTTGNGSAFQWYIDGHYLGAKKDINYTFRDTGCYDIKLIAENENNCIDSTIRSICVFEGFNFYMPDAFTPNSDGLNDVLLPKGSGWLYDNYRLEIFNRWGRKVFSTQNVREGWDGGVVMDPYQLEVSKVQVNDIYIWRAVVTDNTEKTHELKGVVTLVR